MTTQMTKHMTGTREEWLAARLEPARGGEGADAAQRRAGAAAPGAAVGPGRQGVSIRDRGSGAPRWRTCSRGARSSSSTTSCSGPTTRRAVRPARRSRTGSTASAVHLANHDVTLWAVSRAPLEAAGVQAADGVDVSVGVLVRRRLQLRLQRRVHRGSSSARGSIEYNYRPGGHAMAADAGRRGPVAQFAAACGTDAPTYTRERPGMSAFVLEDGVVYHTYSAYARGVDALWGMYPWLDRAPRGATRRACGGGATTSTRRS